jgi:hypothetical protein
MTVPLPLLPLLLLLLLLLLQGPYFLGSDISLVDITFAPMLERAAASLCYYKVPVVPTSLYDQLQAKSLSKSSELISSLFPSAEHRSFYLSKHTMSHVQL